MSGIFVPEIFGGLYAELARLVDTYRQENESLKAMLRGQGLSNAQIRREAKKRSKSAREWKEASALFQEVCERSLALLRASDPVTKIVENLSGTKKRDEN